MNVANNDGEKAITLNIVPISFSSETILIGKLKYQNEEEYKKLREWNRLTHAFRYDSRDGNISNLGINTNIQPLGQIEEAEVKKNLLLLGRGIQQSIINWLANKRPIVKTGKRLTFWGGVANASLLTSATTMLNLEPTPGLDVVIRYDLDTRLFWSPGNNAMPYLGLVIDISTANILDLSVADLLSKGVNVKGKYICKHEASDQDYLRPRLDLIGMISNVDGDNLLLTDTDGINEINAHDAFLEPRSEYLDEIILSIYRSDSKKVLNKLKEIRGPLSTATSKLERIKQTLSGLQNDHHIIFGGGVKVDFGNLLTTENPLFPLSVSTTRPNLLFGPQGRNAGSIPDFGIQSWGPFKYAYHTRNSPVIGVICEAQYKGRVEEFVKLLRDGIPEEIWEKTTNRQAKNPYLGGLIGKFRITRVDIQFEEALGATANDYLEASNRLLNRLPKGLDLAIVQTKDSFTLLRGKNNPYFVTKAAFMEAGVPTQAIKIENIEAENYSKAYILNNLALASYSKLDGIPWVISTPGPVTHELIIGLGYTELGNGRLGEKFRYVGITTLFQGDGRYLLWGLTREVEFDNYQSALLENLRTTIQYVSEENNWQLGDKVRLIFHVYKPLKKVEISAIKELVQNLTSGQYQVEYAFLDISEYHMYHIFDPKQMGKESRNSVKGKGVPSRGLCYLLSDHSGLLQLIGPNELKTYNQGIPKPLLVELHPDSDFSDMTYLLRQIYHFSYMSWQNFFPASEPVTILYSRLIARMLGNLRTLDSWNSKVLSVGSLRDRRWFL